MLHGPLVVVDVVQKLSEMTWQHGKITPSLAGIYCYNCISCHGGGRGHTYSQQPAAAEKQVPTQPCTCALEPEAERLTAPFEFENLKAAGFKHVIAIAGLASLSK